MRNFTISETLVQDDSKRTNVRGEQAISQNTRNIGENVASFTTAFPPFDVLLSWLKYTYHQTGEWPLPPEELQPGQPAVQNTPSVKSYNIRGNQNEQSKEVKNTGANETRTKGLWVVPDTLTSQKTKAEDKVQHCSTNFDYVNSCYFAEASRLVANCTTQSIQDSLLFGCKQVLSLIIAWCRFPLFNGISNRQGRWMILATAHCSRELRMRVSQFRECVEELEAAGLIVTGQAGNGMIERYAFEQLRYDCTNSGKLAGTEASKYWGRHSVQTKTLVYRLGETVELDSTLPAFNPFISGKDENIEFDDRERPCTASESEITNGEDLTIPGKDLELQTIKYNTNSGSFPGIHGYDKLIHDVDDGAITFFSKTKTVKDICPVRNVVSTNSSEMSSKSFPSFCNFDPEQLGRLTTEQRARFDFLNNQASFEGYCRKDGRATLDTQEALKFALMQNLSFEVLQLRYNQVREMWTHGHCKRNPIGLLHWAIVNNCDPRGY
ncbi:MAG TPA: hypothetical protein VH186_15470, partial [Chloroflexia bacterium]|nr:hypothetical protein [Chloroflexia bacterium]